MKKLIAAMITAFTVGVLVAPSLLAAEGIQTQPSPDGTFEATLTRVEVSDGVLSIRCAIKNITSKTKLAIVEYWQSYYIDQSNNKKYFVLADSNRKTIAGPKRDNGAWNYFRYDIPTGEQRLLWMKFPAPPETTKTIDIYLDNFFPFEKVEIMR